jgi:hypothetical protein
MKTILSFIALCLVWCSFAQNYPTITANGFQPNDPVFYQPINASKAGEITIASFNVRDVQGKTRTLEDFQELARLIKNADIVVFQELGAKGFRKNATNFELLQRIDAMIAAYKVFLGDDWDFVLATYPTPQALGMGAELPFVAYRKKIHDIDIRVTWKGYVDLGDKRDMGTFDVICTKGIQEEKFVIGSAHTTPACPKRGEQLRKIGEYAEANQNEKFVLMGDFNWGYKSSCANGYEGENYIKQLHDDGKVFQPFYHLSYNGSGNNQDFRTNLDLRKSVQMYDQFLVCNAYASKLADGGKLTEDCGFIGFSKGKYFEKLIESEAKTRIKGVKSEMKFNGKSTSNSAGKAHIKQMQASIEKHYTLVDIASWQLSDHKPVWIQFKLFD